MGPRTLEEQQGLLGSSDHDIELDTLPERPPTFPSLLSSRSPAWVPSWKSLKQVFFGSTRQREAGPHWQRQRSFQPSSSRYSCRRPCLRVFFDLMWAVLVIGLSSGFLCNIFFPSYTRPPFQYEVLRRRVEREPMRQGTANVNNEKVFIATSLYDPGGELVSGDWADSVTALIRILGPWNVHLSVYENDIDDVSKAALKKFEDLLLCNNTIVHEDLDISTLPHVTTWDGTRRLKRMQFLAEVRNRALRPLQHLPQRFDKLLYINDIVFDPVDAANLLFSTNVDTDGKTQYRAACAVDFENPFKFYDTFATRDTEGYDMGVIFYPWFAGAGSAESRRDVIAQKDAVAVTSCWGGMVAFEAKWFQDAEVEGAHVVDGVPLPLRFRAENDTYWDASECCLIHADLTALSSNDENESGIYMNPYVRVAYKKSVLDWLWVTRRFERLYTPFQSVINRIGGRPTFNPRRLEKPGDQVVDKVWVWDAATKAALRSGTTKDLPNGMQGTFEEVNRKALPGSFCGSRSLSYLLDSPNEAGKKWSHEKVPDGG